jgi:hypothetical protein
MSKSIKQLREDLAVLETNTNVLSAELEEIYSKYLETLGDSVSKQLILATYQICTQKYPEFFLKLSFNERHNLQEKFKDIKIVFEEYLADYLGNIDYVKIETIKKFQQILGTTSLITESENQELNAENEEINSSESVQINEDLEITNKPEKLTPDCLVKLHLHIEHSIHETLKNVSNKANRYLQKGKILPSQIPPKILEMALQAEENGSIMSGAPNLLNLLIEREHTQQENQDRDITPITAICLRLSEIEFSDSILSSYRNQIRAIFAKIEQIRTKYLKKQQELAIAEAEAAWRACWYDNN